MRKMNIFLVAIFVLTTVTAVGQETKKVRIEHKNPWYAEVYFVLKKDKNVKQGNYQKLGYKDCLVIDGYYKDNKKDSLWTEYFWRTEIIKSQGSYRNDKKTGIWIEYHLVGDKNELKSKGDYIEDVRKVIWEFYDRKSELFQKYDFDNNKLVYFKPDDKEYEIKTENGIVKTKLDSPPLFIGGDSEASEAILNAKINYPNIAKEKGTSGTVYISFFIDTNGKAIDHKVETGIGDGCDEEALRVVKQIPNNWLPGYLNGQPVLTKYLYPINFRLN